MKSTKIIAAIVVLLGLTGIGAVIIPPFFARTSNCDGNTAALANCAMTVRSLQLATNEKTKAFDLYSLGEKDKSDLVDFSRCHWNPDAKFLIKRNGSFQNKTKEILVVCDTPYDNVPEPTLWNGYKKTSAYAAGFSDGTVSLISPAQFKELGLSEFIDPAGLGTNLILKATQ